MHLLSPSSHHRADVMMSVGCGTFVSASLILVVPRFGTLLLEILLGILIIGCALVARRRLRRRALGKEDPKDSKDKETRWFDGYAVLMIGVVIVVQACTAGLLRKASLSEGTVNTLPLIVFAGGILLKPRVMDYLEGRKKTKQAGRVPVHLPKMEISNERK